MAAPLAPHYGALGGAAKPPPVLDQVQWCEPTPALPHGHADVLTPQQVRQWHEQRFVCVDGIWPADLIAREAAQWEARFPAPSAESSAEELEARPAPEGPATFPYGDDMEAANHTTVHPRALRAVAQLLGVRTEEILLTQSGGSAKYGTGVDAAPGGYAWGAGGDQPMHQDYGGNTLLVPPIGGPPEAVACILYLSDVTTAGAATAVVPQTPQLYDIPGLSRKWVGHDRFTSPQNRYSLPRGAPGEPGELYKNERLVQYSVGTALLYRHDTWHRGTTTAEGACRLAHSFVWRRADALWVQYGGPWYGCSHNFLAEITPAQRCALGWPAAGHAYWDDPATVEAVGQRYTGVDMTPYHEAAAGRKTRGGDGGGASETPRHKL